MEKIHANEFEYWPQINADDADQQI